MKIRNRTTLIVLNLLVISTILASCGGGKKNSQADAAASIALLNQNQPYTAPTTFTEFLGYMAPCLTCHTGAGGSGGFDLANYVVVAGNPKGSSAYTNCTSHTNSFLWKVVQPGGSFSSTLGKTVDMSQYASGNPTSAIRDWINAGCPQ